MSLWEFLQQWRGGRAAAGVTVSVLLHILVVLAVLWGAKLPLADKWRAKPGDALIVELPQPDESPAPGSPDAPAAAAPSAPAAATPRPPAAPPARPAPPVAKPQAPAPARVASAPRPSEPTPARPAPRPAEAPRPDERAAESAADNSGDKAPAGEASSRATAPKVERVPPGQPGNQQTASLPPGGASGPAVPDMRSALRRGAGGRGQGWAGIEGEPIHLDSVDPDFGPFLQQVKRQIYAKWGYPCVKNPATHGCDYYNARLYVVFGIQKSGLLQVVELQASSGYDIYDEYALNAVRLAAPYPPVPPAMLAKFKTTNVGVPILVQFTYSVETSLGTMLR